MKASCCSSSIGWSWNTSTAYRSMPAWMAATSSGVRGRVMSMPSTSAAKHGPIWRVAKRVMTAMATVLPLA